MNEEMPIVEEQILAAPAVSGEKKPSGLSRVFGKIIDGCILGLTLLIPLWFLPFTLDMLELTKQTLLIGLSLIALLAWIVKSLLDREVRLTRSWLHLVVLFFAASYAVTSFFSTDRYLSFVGNVGQMQWSFITIAAFVLLYFVIVNRLKTAADIQRVIRWFLLGSLIAGIYSLLQMFGIHALGSYGALASDAFNPIGTVNALATYIALATVVAMSSALLGCICGSCEACKKGAGLFWKIVTYAMIAVGAIVLFIADFWPAWVEIIVGVVVLFGIQFIHTRKLPKLPMMITGGVLLGLSVLMLIFPTPIQLKLPSEVAPSAAHSWMIAQATLNDHALFGSGPGTWIYDYAKYRSVAVNTSQFWTVRFDRGLSAFLTMVATLGLIGTSLWLILSGASAAVFTMRLVKEKEDASWNATLTVFVAWITVLVLAFFYNYNVVHHFIFWLFLALFGALIGGKEFYWNQRTKSWVSGVLMMTLIIAGVATISAAWLSGQRLAADIQYSSAVTSFQKGENVDAVIAKMNSAVTLNRLNDNYQRNLSQAYLVKVSQMLQGNPDEAKLKEAGGYVQQAVDAAKQAIALSPNNVDNYSNFAIIYQAITSFIPGADELAIKGYQDALRFEPNNPVFMNEIGKLYILRSDAYRTKLSAKDQQTRDEAQKDVNAQLDQAGDWFNKAITAKPDYAAAHYNLGLAYERQSRLPEAIQKFEQVLSANPQDASVAFQLAILYYRNGNKDASKALFEQVITAQPSFADARWFLSTIYEEEGKLDQAIEQIQKVKETNPDNQVVEARLSALEAKKNPPPVAPPATATSSTQGLPPPPSNPTINSGPTNQNPIKK
jgi:tetratricopeptide (TPR) repeat protein